MDRIYRGNRDIAVETCMPLKEGLYRGIKHNNNIEKINICLLYTSPSPRD